MTKWNGGGRLEAEQNETWEVWVGVALFLYGEFVFVGEGHCFSAKFIKLSNTAVTGLSWGKLGLGIKNCPTFRDPLRDA